MFTIINNSDHSYEICNGSICLTKCFRHVQVSQGFQANYNKIDGLTLCVCVYIYIYIYIFFFFPSHCCRGQNIKSKSRCLQDHTPLEDSREKLTLTGSATRGSWKALACISIIPSLPLLSCDLLACVFDLSNFSQYKATGHQIQDPPLFQMFPS